MSLLRALQAATNQQYLYHSYILANMSIYEKVKKYSLYFIRISNSTTLISRSKMSNYTPITIKIIYWYLFYIYSKIHLFQP